MHIEGKRLLAVNTVFFCIVCEYCHIINVGILNDLNYSNVDYHSVHSKLM